MEVGVGCWKKGVWWERTKGSQRAMVRKYLCTHTTNELVQIIFKNRTVIFFFKGANVS